MKLLGFASTSAVFLALSGSTFAQKKTLDSYVASQGKTLADGMPLIYLEGGRITSTENTLASFNRKVTTIGKIRAIVPIEMVQIDDSFSKKPDLYDGLDLRSKVLYLISTLNANQIRVASTKGIGFGDLDQSQKPILNSIIPKNFQVERREAGDKNYKVTDTFQLTPQQREKVCLKLIKSIYLEMPLVGQNAFCMSDSMDHTALRNLSGFARVEGDQESGPDTVFGVKVRSLVPNKQKPSDINYASSAFDGAITLEAPVTLAQLFTSIRQKFNLSVYADPRVANRKLTLVGGIVRLGDLLAAVGQCVTGTYRKVGSDYVLTSDLIGLGTRKLRFDQWEADIRDYVQKQSREWYKTINKGTALKEVKASPLDPVKTTSELDEYLDKESEGRRPPLPSSMLDSGIRGIVDRFNKEYTSQQVSVDGLTAQNNLRFNFTLPSGQDVFEGGGGSLGTFGVFKSAERWGNPVIPVVAKTTVKLSPDRSACLAIRPKDKDSAKRIVGLAAKFGFREVWIETKSADVLREVLAESKASGIKVRYAIRPWLNIDGKEESDRTLLGDNGTSFEEWGFKNERLIGPFGANDVFRQKLFAEDSVSPDRRPDSWDAYGELAKTSGLEGVVVLDPTNGGYEPTEGQGHSGDNSPSNMAPRKFGYSLSMRSAFLRLNGVDPIDMVPKQLYSSVNVSPYFFPDMELMGFPRTYGRTDGDEFIIDPFVNQWNLFRTKAMTDGLNRLVNGPLKGLSVPVWIDLLPGASNIAVTTMVPLIACTKDEPFRYDKSSPGAFYGAQVLNPAGCRFVFDHDSENMVAIRMRMYSAAFQQKQSAAICYDLSRMTEDELTKFVTSWFEPKS